MTETTSEAVESAPAEPIGTTDQSSETDTPKPKPTETVEFWKAKARDQEKRAKANADAAQRYAELEEAKKSDEQKAAERVAAAEARALELEARANRGEVAGETGVPLDILSGPADSSVESLAEFAEKVIEYAGRSGAPRVPKVDPNQGRGNPVALNGDGLESAIRNKLGIG